MALKFENTSKMVNEVMKIADDTNMDHKKRDIPVDLLDMNPDNDYIFGYQDIDFLADEIDDGGFHGAIEVCAKPDGSGRYEIIAGHRRFLACKKNGFQTIPCIVSEYKDETTISEQLIMSNVHQRNLSPLRMARAINHYEKNVLPYKEYTGRKRDYLAKKFNMSTGSIQRYLSILKMIPELQHLCDKKDFPFTYFVSVSQYPEELQKKLYDNLLKLAPEGKIEELSRKTIDQQLEAIKMKEQRAKESKGKEETDQGNNDPHGQDTLQKPPVQPVPPLDVQPNQQLSGVQNGSKDDDNGFFSYDNASAGMKNLDETPTEHHPGLDDTWAGEESADEAVDKTVLYYISKIETTITEPGAVYENKDNLIDMLSQLLEKLKE